MQHENKCINQYSIKCLSQKKCPQIVNNHQYIFRRTTLSHNEHIKFRTTFFYFQVFRRIMRVSFLEGKKNLHEIWHIPAYNALPQFETILFLFLGIQLVLCSSLFFQRNLHELSSIPAYNTLLRFETMFFYFQVFRRIVCISFFAK